MDRFCDSHGLKTFNYPFMKLFLLKISHQVKNNHRIPGCWLLQRAPSFTYLVRRSVQSFMWPNCITFLCTSTGRKTIAKHQCHPSSLPPVWIIHWKHYPFVVKPEITRSIDEEKPKSGSATTTRRLYLTSLLSDNVLQLLSIHVF